MSTNTTGRKQLKRTCVGIADDETVILDSNGGDAGDDDGNLWGIVWGIVAGRGLGLVHWKARIGEFRGRRAWEME